MKRADWKVGEHSIRPAGKPDECFYCHASKEAQHNAGCVIRERTIVVNITIEIVRTVPEDWGEDMINFHMNESSWCASNIIDELAKQDERMSCLCQSCSGEYVREATEEDETAYGLRVADCAS